MKKFMPITIVLLIFLTCGNEPPEEFYKGIPEDDSAIVGILADSADFLLTDDICTHPYTNFLLPDVEFSVSDSYFRTDSTIIKIHPDSVGDTITVKKRFQDLWYAKDTTCTVYLWDTFTIFLDVHYDKKFVGYYFWPQGDTDKVIDKIDTITTPDDTTFTVTGEGVRHLFFEPLREKKVDEETGDTIMAIKEPREWHMRRISYGEYYFPDRGADIPYIYKVTIQQKGSNVIDSIIAFSYDTLYPGHVINRFRAIDSLFEFNKGDTLIIDFTLAGLLADNQCVFFVLNNGKRFQMGDDGRGTMVISGDKKIVNLIFLVATRDSYYYLKPAQKFLARAWIVPVRFKD